MLKRAALVVVVVLLTAGCGTAEKAAGPAPIERHLVYQKLIGERGIWMADVDGSHPELLVREGDYHEISFPQISPDGTQVAYVGDCGASHCANAYVISTSGGRPRRFASGIEGLSWSPDSTRMAGVEWPSKNLVSIDVATGDEMTLAHGELWGWSFSPDGKEIVFARTHEPGSENFGYGKVDLFVTDLDGGTDPKQITDTGDSIYPVWGPKSIAFAKLIPPLWRGRHEIWQVQPDGSGLKTITGSLPERFLQQGFTGLLPIDWSDDGRELLGAWGNEWGEIPVAVSPASGEIREFVEGLAWGTVAISSDRFALAYTYNHIDEPDEKTATVVVIPLGDGKPKVVARGAGYPSWNR